MFEIDTMFDDSARMIEVIASKRPSVRDVMVTWLQYCRDNAPQYSETWDRLASLDFEADFLRLTNWLEELLRTDPPGEDIRLLRFGLYNPSFDGAPSLEMYLSGTRQFDVADPYADWPSGEPDYVPQGNYSNSAVLPAIYLHVNNSIESDESYLGEAFLAHGYVAAVVAQWCHGSLADQLVTPTRSRAVEIGHDSGDSYSLHLPN